MKRKILLLPILFIALCFSGCGTQIPTIFKNDVVAKTLSVYAPEHILLKVDEEDEDDIQNIKKEFPFEVPSNYKNTVDYIFAVLNDNKEIVGYKIAIQKSDQSWEWKDCDISGTIKEEPQSSKEETSTQNSSEKDKKPTQKPKEEKPNNGSSNTTSPSPPTTSAPPPTTSAPQENKFTWKIISQANCPMSVSNLFDNYIIKNQSATVSSTKGNNTYVLVKAASGQGVKINSISENGIVSYSYVTDGDNYVIAVVNKSIGINFSKK